MLRYQKAFSESDWEDLHARLAQFYQNRIEHTRLADRLDQFQDEQCFAYHIEKCYHQLCENYNNAIPLGVRGFATTLRVLKAAQAFPWVTTVLEAEAFFQGMEQDYTDLKMEERGVTTEMYRAILELLKEE